MNRCCEFVTML